MIEFRKRIPSFVDSAEIPQWQAFASVEEMLQSEWIRKWAEPSRDGPFTGFRVSDNCLMSIYDEGFHWWVLGFVRGDTAGIQQWEGGKYRARLDDGSEAVLAGDQVRSSCAGWLTLADGTKAADLATPDEQRGSRDGPNCDDDRRHRARE